MLTLPVNAGVWGDVLSLYVMAIAGLCVCRGIMNHGFSFSILKDAVRLPSMIIGSVCFLILAAEAVGFVAHHILIAIIAVGAVAFYLKGKRNGSTKAA